MLLRSSTDYVLFVKKTALRSITLAGLQAKLQICNCYARIVMHKRRFKVLFRYRPTPNPMTM